MESTTSDHSDRSVAASFQFSQGHGSRRDKPQVEALMRSSKHEMELAGLTEGEVKVQVDQHYATYARLSDRLCVNLVSTCFPTVQRMTA